MVIESKDNKLIKYAKKLESKKFAVAEGKTLIESPKIIKELIIEGFDIECIFVAKNKNIYFYKTNSPGKSDKLWPRELVLLSAYISP